MLVSVSVTVSAFVSICSRRRRAVVRTMLSYSLVDLFSCFLPSLTTLNYLLSALCSVLCFHSHCAIYSPGVRYMTPSTLDPRLCTSTYMIYALCLMLTVKFVCRRQQVSHWVALVRISPLPVVKFVRCGVLPQAGTEPIARTTSRSACAIPSM